MKLGWQGDIGWQGDRSLTSSGGGTGPWHEKLSVTLFQLIA